MSLEPLESPLLSDLLPAVGRIIHTLLTTECRLSQREFADQANVSARTIRNYHDRLEALDLIRVDESGYRLALSFRTATERREPLVPTGLEENQTLLDAADALLDILLPPDPGRLLDHPRVGLWLQLAAALTATDSTENNQAVQMGPPLKQQALCT